MCNKWTHLCLPIGVLVFTDITRDVVWLYKGLWTIWQSRHMQSVTSHYLSPDLSILISLYSPMYIICTCLKFLIYCLHILLSFSINWFLLFRMPSSECPQPVQTLSFKNIIQKPPLVDESYSPDSFILRLLSPLLKLFCFFVIIAFI